MSENKSVKQNISLCNEPLFFNKNNSGKDAKNISFNHDLEQSQKLAVYPYSLSLHSKKSQQSLHLQQNSFVDAFGEEAVKALKHKKEKNNQQQLSLADIFFKIKFKVMAKRLLQQTRSFMFKNLSIRQFKQIDDKSWALDKNSQNSIMPYKKGKFFFKIGTTQKSYGLNSQKTMIKSNENIKKFENITDSLFVTSNKLISKILKIIDRKFPVMDPICYQKVIWGFLNIILILVYTLQIPLFITFPQQKSDKIHWAMIISVPIFIFIDILFTLNTGQYHKGTLIKKRMVLFSLNLKSRIIPSILTISLYLFYIIFTREDCMNNRPKSRWLDIILLPLFQKLTDIGSIINKLEEHQTLSKKHRNIIALIKLILQIIYIGHFISCFWVMVAQYEARYIQQTWAKYPVFDDILWHQLYIDAYYFTTVTMITVGYGDIIPVTQIEKTICVIIMIFSCGVFAYSMNTIGGILEIFYEDQKKLTQNMQIINSYMTRKNVGKQIKNQIREYLFYYWKEESERNQDAEDKIISILSDNLKKNLLMESKNVVLKKSSIFRSNFSDDVKEKIAPLIKEYRCYPEEIICLEGELDECSIYFIEKGSVEIFLDQKDSLQLGIKTIASLGKGQSFGETSFFTGKARSASVRSREFTTLLILNRNEFLQVLVNHQEDYEKFCALKDSLSLYENYQLLNVQCLSCQSYGHQILKCPYLHYTVNHTKLRETFIRNPLQERTNFQRKNKKSNSVVNIHIVIQKALEYEEDYSWSIEYQYLSEFYESIHNMYQEEEIKLSNHEKVNQDINGCMSIREESEDDNFATSSEDENKMTESKGNASSFRDMYKDQQGSDEIDGESDQITMSIDKKYKINDKISFSKENCLSPQLRDGKGINHLNVITEDKSTTINSPDRFRQGQRVNSYFESQQNTNGSIENRNQAKKLSIIQAMDRRGSSGGTINIENKKPSPIHFQGESLFCRQKSRKITNLQPQKNAEVFKNFLARGANNVKTEEIFKNIGIKQQGNQECKRNERKNKKQKLYVKNGSNQPNSVKLTPQLSSFSGQGEKRRFSKFNSSEFKNLNSQLKNNQEDQKCEMYVSQQIDLNQQESDPEQVEDHFDCMQNFEYYFPLNNFNYQISIMSLSPEQKKQIMLRAYYENINNMGQAKISNVNNQRSQKKQSVFIQNRKSKQLGTLIDGIGLEGDQNNKYSLERRKSKFFTNKKSVILSSSSKMNLFDGLDRKDRQESLVMAGQIQQHLLKNPSYKFSVNNKLDLHKNNSLQNKPTSTTITDQQNNFDFPNSSQVSNHIKSQNVNKEQSQTCLIQELDQDQVALNNLLKNDDQDDLKKSEEEVISKSSSAQNSGQPQFYNKSIQRSLINNNNNNNNSIYIDYPQNTNNTFITFENTHIKINEDLRDNFVLDNSFQEDVFQQARDNKDQSCEEIQSEIDQSKNSIKCSNMYVTQKKQSIFVQK